MVGAWLGAWVGVQVEWVGGSKAAGSTSKSYAAAVALFYSLALQVCGWVGVVQVGGAGGSCQLAALHSSKLLAAALFPAASNQCSS